MDGILPAAITNTSRCRRLGPQKQTGYIHVLLRCDKVKRGLDVVSTSARQQSLLVSCYCTCPLESSLCVRHGVYKKLMFMRQLTFLVDFCASLDQNPQHWLAVRDARGDHERSPATIVLCSKFVSRNEIPGYELLAAFTTYLDIWIEARLVG